MIRLALAASLAMIAAPGHAYLSQNNQHVTGSEGRFEVLASPGQGASVSWCAAGDYVVRGLGLPGATRIWRITAPPRKLGQGVGFALSAEGAQKTGLIGFGFGDESLSATAAHALCPEKNNGYPRF